MENALAAETEPDGFSKDCDQETEINRKKDRRRTRRVIWRLGDSLPIL